MNTIFVMYQSHLLVKSMSNYSWKYNLFVLNLIYGLCLCVARGKTRITARIFSSLNNLIANGAIN